MRTLDLDQLRTFIVVVETGSLTAAAPRVVLSQSAVSEQMRKLEERVGVRLLVRGKAGAVPTPAGRKLAGHARRMLALSDEALADLRDDALDGELRVGVTDYFRPSDLTTLLAHLRESHPGVRLSVTVRKSDAVEAGYADGEFDMAVSMRVPSRKTAGGARTAASPRGADDGAFVLRREPLLWMGADGLRHAAKDGAAPLDLVVLPDTCALHRFTIRLLRSHRVPFRVAHVASGVAGLQSALAAGLGVACLNASALADGIARLSPPHGLPALPQVTFRLLPPRDGESPFVARARTIVASALA